MLCKFQNITIHHIVLVGISGAILLGATAYSDAFVLNDPSGTRGWLQTARTPNLTWDEEQTRVLPARLRRQIVGYPTRESSGTVIVDTQNTYLYFVLGNGRAIRYGIGVGRAGFTWSGVQHVARKAEWPDWTPTAEMLVRQPYLPRWMAGGASNPLGARAIYLGGTPFRIHGTNQPSTIGGRVSSGCIRMLNDDVVDLYGRVQVGTKVVVLPAERHARSDHILLDRVTMTNAPIKGSNDLRMTGLY
jgi:lipoprotein-anchoring transpeptidase ErfK/SrfK